jgi:hypothetical protein
MGSKDDIREFLVSRRAKITPEQAGLPAYGTNRRVSGPFDLVRATSSTNPARRQPSRERVRPIVQQILDSMSMTPAYVRNGSAGRHTT